MDYKELVKLGLSEKEAKVYLASLEIGKAVVQDISKKAKVNRATTYVVIESLTKKGLFSSYQEGKKQYFSAEHPEKLSILFRDQVLAIQRKQEDLEKLLPSLLALKTNDKEKPTVRYFEGKDGLWAMGEEFFLVDHKEEARMIYSVDLLKKVFSEEERMAMRSKRQNYKIRVKSIINDKTGTFSSPNATNFTISSDEYPITSDIAMFGDKIRIATQKGKLVGMIIENQEIADTLKVLFDLACKYLDKEREEGKS